MIIEVLSDSTESYDRGKKFAHYRTIDSLREYVLVSQNECRIERFSRKDNGNWLYSESTDPNGSIELASVACRLSLSQVYHKVDFERAKNQQPAYTALFSNHFRPGESIELCRTFERNRMKRFGQLLSAAALLVTAVSFSGDAAGRFDQKLIIDKQIVHVLNRLTFGPRPGDTEQVRRIGIACYQLTMAGLDPATQSARVCGLNESLIRSRGSGYSAQLCGICAPDGVGA